MAKTSWQFGKLLNKVLYILIFSCFINQVIAGHHTCDLNWITDHPIDKCAELYEKKIFSLTIAQKQEFEKQFEKIQSDKTLDVVKYEEISYFSNHYPTPLVLFTKLQLEEKLDKDNQDDIKVSYDDVASSKLLMYENTLNVYEIITKMLEKKKDLTSKEENILSVSKQRSLCLGYVLSDLRNNPEKSIAKKIIIDKCYK
jgi:hypothetical protein